MKKTKQKTVLVGMSGGVDSSVAALLLKKKGYRVIGMFMKNFSDTKNPFSGECAWIEERRMAYKIAALIDIPIFTADFEEQYKKYVIAPMFRTYEKGMTPNPDMACNKIIKFPLLWKEAKKLKADYIATGHYARIKTANSFELHAAKDKSKDQSYFLAELSQADLSHTLFPIGNLTKSEVRKIAKKSKFPNYDKRSTRGICFVGKLNMKSFLERRIKNKEGKIISPSGKIVGKHPGIMYFTIGQRVGSRLGMEISKHLEGRWYIAEKKNNNVLVIAPKNHPLLKKQLIRIKNFHLIAPKEKIPLQLKARIRHLGELHKGKLFKKKGSYCFMLKKPIEQVAKGQYIVLYNRDKVVACGEISY